MLIQTSSPSLPVRIMYLQNRLQTCTRLLQTAEIEPRKAVTSNYYYLLPRALRRKRKLDAIAVSVTLLRAAIMMMGDTGRRKF